MICMFMTVSIILDIIQFNTMHNGSPVLCQLIISWFRQRAYQASLPVVGCALMLHVTLVSVALDIRTNDFEQLGLHLILGSGLVRLDLGVRIGEISL